MQTVLLTLVRNPKAAFGLGIVLLFVLIAIAAPLLTPYEPTARVGGPHQPPSWDHWLGTTRIGRDVWTQLLYGARSSLLVGFATGFLIAALGVAVGITAGYLGGWVDEGLTFLTNVVLVIPNLPLLLVLAAFLGQAGPLAIALIIGLTSWAWGARVVRAQTLALRRREFIQASELLGEPRWRVIAVELLPNLISIVGINFIGSVIYTVITQATLEFLGLGDPLAVSWGTMLYNAQTSSALIVGAWWEVFAPCAAVAVFGGSLALINFAIDEVANPRLRTLPRVPKSPRPWSGRPIDTKTPVSTSAPEAKP